MYPKNLANEIIKQNMEENKMTGETIIALSLIGAAGIITLVKIVLDYKINKEE